jgi:hypothetical protein
MAQVDFQQAKEYQRTNPATSRKELMRRFGICRSSAWRVRHLLRREGIAVPLRRVGANRIR